MKSRNRFLSIRSRHPSHKALRRNSNFRFPFRAVYRLGSTTELTRKYDVELNSIQGIRTSSNKILMKQAFDRVEVKTCEFWLYKNSKFVSPKEEVIAKKDFPFPIVAKHKFGSRGQNNYKLDNLAELDAFIKANSNLHSYVFERFTSYCREYRLHVSELGCFYTCRKVRRNETSKEDRWKFNNTTSNWLLEGNESFNKPETWDDIVEDCKKAIKEIGLSIGAFDIKTSKKGDWKIIEVNSAPSLGDIGIAAYEEHLPKLINHMYNVQR